MSGRETSGRDQARAGDTRMIKNFLPPLALLASVLAVGGCVSFGGKAPGLLVRLSPMVTAPAGSGAAVRPGGATPVLVVDEPEVDRTLAVGRVPVRVNDTQVAYLKDATWVERPSRQFRALLAETLRARNPGGRLVLEDDQTGAEPPAAATVSRLDGRLNAMGYEAQGRAVVVRFDAIRKAPDGSVTTRRFEARAEGVSPEPRAVVTALNRVANEVAGQVADWMAG